MLLLFAKYDQYKQATAARMNVTLTVTCNVGGVQIPTLTVDHARHQFGIAMPPPLPPARKLSPRQLGCIGGGYLSVLGTLAGQTVFISLVGGAICEEFAIVFLGPPTDRFSAPPVGSAP